MFCPGCGLEERDRSRFCRSCGGELDAVRRVLDQGDTATEAFTTAPSPARNEVGRAIADKIREIEDTRDFRKVMDHTLPMLEKFLETPEEKRLRSIREGLATASVGLGLAFFGIVLSHVVHQAEVAGLILIGAAGLVFLIGVAIAIGGWLFTAPRTGTSTLNQATTLLPRALASREPTEPGIAPPSIVEGTTYKLTDADRNTAPK